MKIHIRKHKPKWELDVEEIRRQIEVLRVYMAAQDNIIKQDVLWGDK